MDQQRSFENFEVLPEAEDHALPEDSGDEAEEEVDCDFGLNDSDENITITDDSMEPDVNQTKRVNMLI